MTTSRLHRRSRWMGALACLAVVAAACGQYPRTHELAVANANAQGVGTLDSTGAGQSGQGTLGTGSTGGSLTGGGPVGGPAQTSGTGTSSAPAAPVNAPGHTTSGVTATSITIGIHAPITGAAPVTDASFQEGKDLYWKYGNNGKPFSIYGRQVSVLVEDDHYNPTQATLVCKKMVEQNHAFLLIGGAGTDQIVACAKYAATQPGPVPYLSAGVTQEPLERYGNYFALSMSYPQQVPLLVDYMKKKLGVRGPKDVAMVATNTANFDDAVEAWEREMPGSDVYRPNKSDESAPQTYGQRMCNGPLDKYKVVFPLLAPLFWLQMAQAATCKPTWAGIGITMGLDAVAEVVCGEGYRTGSAHFFSPAAAFTDVGAKNAEFMKAARSKGVDADDIMWLLWGTAAGLHQLFLKTGADLSRERFIQTTAAASVDGEGVFPSLKYSPSDHFGATAVNVLRLNCPASGTGYWLTEAKNVTGF